MVPPEVVYEYRRFATRCTGIAASTEKIVKMFSCKYSEMFRLHHHVMEQVLRAPSGGRRNESIKQKKLIG